MDLRLRLIALFTLSILAIGGANGRLAAGGATHARHCAKCGCAHNCCKVCRLERTDKETLVTIWGFKCEDFCLPGPSTPKCEHCQSLYDDKAKDPAISCLHPFVWTEWLSNCRAKMFTRRKLHKQEVIVKTPSFKWVVEDLCPDCQAACQTVPYPADSELPAPPQVEGAIVIAGYEESTQDTPPTEQLP